MVLTISERAQLRQLLVSRFDLNELKNLAFDIGVDFQVFSYQDKETFSRELIAMCERHIKLYLLVSEAQRLRPDSIYLAQLLAKLPASDGSYKKVQIIVSENMLDDVTIFLDAFATMINCDKDEVTLISATLGSMHLLVSLPEQKILPLINLPLPLLVGDKNKFYRVIETTIFDSLDVISQNTWRYVTINQPPIRLVDQFHPTISWQNALKATNDKHWVLIVDDQPNWRKLLAGLLSNKFNVFVADSYLTALDALQNYIVPFHVLVTDLRLDDRDQANEAGLALIMALERMVYRPKAILVTGYPTLETMDNAYRKLSVFRYLNKYPGKGMAFDHNQFRQIVQEAAIEAEKEREVFAFVLMPFAKKYQAIYENVVKKTVEANGLPCLRADDFYEARRIMEDIRRGIRDATYLIADLSGRNPNVFYEVGIAHAEGKLPILLTQSMDDMPPRLKSVRFIVYDNSLEGAEQLQANLSKTIQNLRQNNFITSPLFIPVMDQADPKFCFALMPPVQSSNTVYKHIIKKATEENALNSENILHVFDIHNVTDAILERIYKARVIIADLSGRDPDVFYLTGICHGLDKDVILLACEPNDIPFDLRELGHVIYSTESFAEGIKAGNKLKLILKQILNKAPTNSRNKDIQTHTPTIVNSKNEVDDKQKNQEHNVNRTDLRQKLGTHFNVGELRTLCFDLGVDYENIPSLTKEEMVREMVLYCERHGRFNDLIVLCHGLRPHVNW